MAVCIAYFDASGSPGDKNRRQLTVAGYVATESQWKRFERKWEEVLRAANVSGFHFNEFAHFKGDFEYGWSGSDKAEKRKVLIQDLVRVIKRHVRMAFSESVYLDDFDAVNAAYELDTLCKPYSLCAAQVISQVRRWMQKQHPKDDTLFVFEKGDTDQEHLEVVLQRRRMHLPHPPIFAEKHWKVNGEDRFLRPFEACDLWAYEDALGLRIIGTGKRARGSMQHLSEQIPYTRGLYNQKGLRAICEELKVAKRNRA